MIGAWTMLDQMLPQRVLIFAGLKDFDFGLAAGSNVSD
jgi:hypothetical protein